MDARQHRANAEPDSVIAAFTEAQVERLTGLSVAQLRYWDRTDFFKPTFAEQNRRVAYSRLYSFRDVAALRVLGVLRRQYGVPLQHLRQVARHLAGLPEERWTRTALYVLQRRVVVREQGADEGFREVVSGQYVLPSVQLGEVVADTRRIVAKMRARDTAAVGQVSTSRHVLGNAPVVAGTRIPVAAIRRFVEAGHTVEQICTEYPGLTAADVAAALAHGGEGKVA
ncbi:hypothetical protein STAQ_15720 [Allostella sp. ATCC 35155]|nr:hypothetical protein STAQ_15720 [Stella sp. ATCC 35155]